MRGRLWGVGVASVVGCIAVVFAAGVKAQTPSGIAGTWKLDVAKSTFSPSPAPKRMTVTCAPIKDGVHKVDLDTAAGAQHWDMTPMYDGKDYPIHGSPDADTIACKRINARTGESTLKKNGKVAVAVLRSLSEDGKTLTLTMKGTNPDGQARNDTLVFGK
jgi:hypothetical protein